MFLFIHITRFTALPETQTDCCIPFNQSQVAVHIQREVRLQVATMPRFSVESRHPEVISRNCSRCLNVSYYHNIVTNSVDIHRYNVKYYLDCPSDCSCSLSYSEWITSCPGNTMYTSLIIYPLIMHEQHLNVRLYLSNNQISDLSDNVLTGFDNIGFLTLSDNQISHLPDGIFTC